MPEEYVAESLVNAFASEDLAGKRILLPRAADAFDEHGHLKNKDQTEQFKTVIQKLARAARVLHG